MENETLIDSGCVVLARSVAQGFEVLLARRSPEVSMAPDHWVFPGGTVEACDREGGQNSYRRAAMREAFEEVAAPIPSVEQLIDFAHWVTPSFFPKRYRTYFYLLPIEPFEPIVDGVEIVETIWLSPQEALSKQGQGELDLMFPTAALLDWMSDFQRLDALIARLQQRSLSMVCPTLGYEGGRRYLSIDPSAGYRLQRWFIDR